MALEPLLALASRGLLVRWRGLGAAFCLRSYRLRGSAVAETPSPLGCHIRLCWAANGGRAVVCALGLTARCSLRSLVKVRQSTQQSADRSTQRRCGPRLAVNSAGRRWVAPASCWVARPVPSPRGGAKRSSGRNALPHHPPPGAGDRHRLRPCHNQVGICSGSWGPSPHTPARLPSLAGTRPSGPRKWSRQAGPRQAREAVRSPIAG